MAAITKIGGGVRTTTEQTGTTLSSIALAAPGPGFVNRVLAVHATQKGGTSVEMRTEVQHSASVQDATGVIVKVGRTQRAAGAASQFNLIGSKQVPIATGGNNQQTSINITGDVADSTETHLTVVWDTARI